MKIIAEKAISKKGVPYTKTTAEIWNSKNPSQSGEMYVSLVGDEVKEEFAANAVEENDKLVVMIDDRKSEFVFIAEPSEFEKPFLKLLIYKLAITEYKPREEAKDIFELRNELGVCSCPQGSRGEKGEVNSVGMFANDKDE